MKFQQKICFENPIHTAFSGASPYFTANPGDQFRAWDMQIAADYMPTRNITFRPEFNRRWANIPYFSGTGGVTPPSANGSQVNSGAPGSDPGTGWTPDLTKGENRITAAMMVRL